MAHRVLTFSRRGRCPHWFLAGVLLVMVTPRIASAGSAYLIADHHTQQFDAWSIDAGDCTVAKVGTYSLSHTDDPAGIALYEEYDEFGEVVLAHLLITSEFDVGIEVADAISLTSLGWFDGPTGLSGIDVDDANGIIYTVDQATNDLYAYTYDAHAVPPTLTPIDGFEPMQLPNCQGAYGIALDTTNGILWVADSLSDTVRAYDTDTWEEDTSTNGSFIPSLKPVGIAVDTDRGFVYTVSISSLCSSAPSGSGSNLLSKFDLAMRIETTVDTGHDCADVAVHRETGCVYVTAGCYGNDLAVWDTDTTPFTQIQTEILARPGGICIKTASYLEACCLPGSCEMLDPLSCESLGGEPQGPGSQCAGDCNSNGIADECEPDEDCNTNGIQDICDIAAGTSQDCNGDSIPDECELDGNDCNGNGIPDDCDIAGATSEDCQSNDVPDECDIAGGTSEDCQTNGVPDECELAGNDCNSNGTPDDCDIAAGTSEDCQPNDVPDECDIAGGTSDDCTTNGIPDDCEPDCNTNGVADSCDIAAGTSQDCNSNGTPDECEAFGPVIFVDENASGADDGSSWADAYNDLQSALSVTPCLLQTMTNVEIWVAAGTYTPAGPGGDREATFHLISGVGLYGGFVGWETNRDQRDVDTNTTGLSGDLNGNDEPGFAYNGENSYHVVTGTDVGSNALLDGFTVTGGNADGSYNNYGGGMYSSSGSPTLANCTFSGNSANILGGGMHNEENSNPTLTNCTFTDNWSQSFGGGMCNLGNSSPTLTNCTFTGNAASYGGGGMFNCSYSSPTLTNCTFSGNSAYIEGGGMDNEDDSSPTLTNCTFSGNSTDNIGGGMCNWDSSPTLANCTFSGNSTSSGDGGGGMFNANSSPTVTNCVFWANSAGGGMDESAQIDDIHGGGESIVNYTCIQGLTGALGGIGNIDDDPLFVTGPLGDYYLSHVGQDSPCIDVGSDTAVNLGLAARTTRTDELPDTGIVDMGYHYYTEGGCNVNGIPDTCDVSCDAVNPDTGNLCSEDYANSCGLSSDCNSNGIPDECEPDCNTNGVSDDCDIAGGTSEDCNSNGIPDECMWLEDDCNTNGVPDECDIAGGTSEDCQPNQVPDECELVGNDCNSNGIPDECEEDCNDNGTPDDCDLAAGTSEDCNSNGIPDECDIAAGTSQDCNSNGTPDECEPLAIFFVDAGATAGANDGTSWADAYVALQDALDQAELYSGLVEIWVAAGTYTPDQGMDQTPGNRYATFQFLDYVSTYGGFAGTETERHQRDWVANDTILSGDLDGDDKPGFVNNSENSYHVVTGGGTDETPLLDGFTIASGNANGSSYPYNCGAGMLNIDGNPTLTNCTFTENSAGAYGGGMYNDSSSPTLTNCTFTENSASYSGGGIYSYDSSPTLTNCILWANSDSGGMDESAQIHGGWPVVRYSCIQGLDAFAGNDNIGDDPLFVAGPLGCYYLSQTAAGQPEQSPCVDAGSNGAADPELFTRTTRRDEYVDTNGVDMGYHYPITGVAFVAGDSDADGDVDLADFARFQTCFTDPGPATLGCNCCFFDFEWPYGDGDVDLDDYVEFHSAFTGPQP